MLFFTHPVFTVIENGTEHYHEQEIKADSLQVRRSHLFLEHLLALVLSRLFFPNLYLHCRLANKLKCETVNCHLVAPLQTFGHLFFFVLLKQTSISLHHHDVQGSFSSTTTGTLSGMCCQPCLH